MRLGSACRDDTNDFFSALLIKGVHDQQNRSLSYGSNRYPAFLVLERLITLSDGIGIVENKDCSLKTNIVFAKILPVLVLIPFKSHR